MFKQITSHPKFWKSVFTLALFFCVIYIVIDFAMTFNLDFEKFKAVRLQNYAFVKLILGGLASGSIYGFIVSYFKFKSKIKQSNHRDQ